MPIQKKFCESLKVWFDSKNLKVKDLVAKINKGSQPYISNVLRGERCGNEVWRRMVADKIGLPYNRMIGIEDENTLPSIISLEDKEYFNVTKKFKKKARAIRINEKLIYAEQLDEDSLDKIERQIDLELEDLEKRVGIKKRQAANGED